MVERREGVQDQGVGGEPQQQMEVGHEGLPTTQGGNANREADTRHIVEGEQPGHPVAFSVPPDVLLPELAAVVWVQDEPVVVPQHAPGEVHRPRLALGRNRPFHAHGKVGVEDENREEEHEGVVAGQRLAVRDEAVDSGRKAGGPEPGRGLLGPAPLPFALDFDAGEDRGEQGPEEDGTEHDAPFKGLRRDIIANFGRIND